MDSLRSPFGRTSCVCRRYAPRLNSHGPEAITAFKADKHASYARLQRLVWAVGFKPTASRFQTECSDQAELYPGCLVDQE